MEAGQEQVIHQEVRIGAILEEAASLVRPMAQSKGIPFVIEPPVDDGTIVSDMLKVRQILTNLLTNAVKFTDGGEITLGVRCDENDCFFTVHDTGIGIAADHLDRVFEPFWQVEQTASRRVGGTGLGLSVTRRLAKLLGGDVTVESTKGEGSSFILRLPRAPIPRD
jgi:signal transduction histidine kinase